jgi:putative Mg2+ transporter-C (MgtC) family protein
MEHYIDFYLRIDPEIMLRVILAMVLGGFIGLEREFHGRPAGLRTHILVCVGSTVIMLASEPLLNIYSSLTATQKIQIDPGRTVAGIVTGIGFLGAGAILKLGDSVRGLTTAACIWFVAALGIVIGVGSYSLAFFSTFIVLLTLLMLDWIERFILPYLHRTLMITTRVENLQKVHDASKTILNNGKILIRDRKLQINRKTDVARIVFTLHVKSVADNLTLSSQLMKMPEIQEIDWD